MKDISKSRRSTNELIKLMNNPTAEELEQNPNHDDNAPNIGRYGRMFQEYLKENYPGRVTELALTTTLWDICAEVNKEALEMRLTVEEQLRKKNPFPKQRDYLQLLQYINWLFATAEEIVLNEVVYKYR